MQTLTSSYVLAPHIIDDRCHVCGKCMARQVCRPRAILVEEPGEVPFIDASRCYGCRVCVQACPFDAILA